MDYFMLAFVLFALVATGGVVLLAGIVSGKSLPGFLPTGHGLAALAALAVLFFVNLTGESATPAEAWWALGVFTLGLLGGLIFFRVLFPKSAPVWLLFGHGSLGGIGLYLLYQAAF